MGGYVGCNTRRVQLSCQQHFSSSPAEVKTPMLNTRYNAKQCPSQRSDSNNIYTPQAIKTEMILKNHNWGDVQTDRLRSQGQ